MIHVVLLSCERLDYTMRTVDSFLEHNSDLSGFELWHCDDASQDSRIREAVGRTAFKPLVYTRERAGVTAMIRRASRKLMDVGAEWMLLLENDWETVRPFPWAAFQAVVDRGDVYTMRLYGDHKERGGVRPAGTRHRGRNGAQPNWQRFDSYEVGDIHWGNPPSVSRVEQVVWLHQGVSTEKQAIVKSGMIQLRSARVVENVVYHIGESRTPEFRA